MVENQALLDGTFGALADPTRRAILARLLNGDSTVTELAEPFDISLQAVSKHIKVLGRAGLVRQTRKGRIQRCRVETGPLFEALAWIERYRRFWDERLAGLSDFLAAEGDGS